MALPGKLIGALFVVLLIAGCGMKVTTDFDKSVDFSRLRTYDWAPREESATSDPRAENSLLISRIRTAVERELSAMGYRKAATGDPDFLVGHLVTTQTRFPPSFKDAGWQSGLPTEVDQYEEGTLILDLIDPNGMRLMWRGTATTPLDESAGPRQREATINEAVQSILKRFPPQQK